MSFWKQHYLGAVTLCLLFISHAAHAQTHEAHSASKHSMHSSEANPVEAGQSAFAAIAEIVALVDADPNTDWSQVNIDGLRSHLVDMDHLTLLATVSSKQIKPQIMQFQINGKARTLAAIHTMVPTHAKMVRSTTGWDIDVKVNSNGVTLTVDPGSDEAFIKLKALGFFGFMTIGAHHQAHHYQMAIGNNH